ncbi:dipeptidase [Shewanella colwelliana]|uniref:dipeptidase n=1 Tax=Shewanella colwelliana TaxID=23 RepID=UPI003D056AEC
MITHHFSLVKAALLTAFFSICISPATNATIEHNHAPISTLAIETAELAVSQYGNETVKSLASLVRYKTVAVDGMTPDTNPEFIGLKRELKALSETLGLDYADHGYVVLIGLGESKDKLGVITHGDVQPADATLWQTDPFELNKISMPGLLIGRGTEDDKGPIVTAMYAMKTINDRGLKLNRRIELMVYMAEESDWDPLKAFLDTFTPAEINITIDAEYPVVTAEKGWSQIKFIIPNVADALVGSASLVEFSGGVFASQIPQQARAEIVNIDAKLVTLLKHRAEKHPGVQYQFIQQGNSLTVLADGKSTHSSTPEDGVNAVTHLAMLLAGYHWPATTAALTQRFVGQMIGLGLYAEQFGEIGYSDPFMGQMSLAPTVIKAVEQGTEVTINLRRPLGKTAQTLDEQTFKALSNWQQANDIELIDVDTYWGEPKLMDKAPHLNTLLSVFGHFAGVENPQPVAIGGSTNSKLFPNALSFGPAMPGVEYTGHSEHEFITHEQFMLNLKMYTAAFVELAVQAK